MAPLDDASDTAIAVSLTALGLLADTVVLAARRTRSEASGCDEPTAFDSARGLLMQVRSFSGMTVPDWAVLRSRPPVADLEETFGAVTRNRGHSSVEAYLETLIGSLESISAGSATPAQVEAAIKLFDDISLTTLRRTSHRRRRHRSASMHERRGRRSVAASVT